MSLEAITTIIVLAIPCLGGIFAIVRGEMKKYIVQMMEEAEKSGLSGKEKLNYVIEKVKKKYKVLELILNVKKFVEYIISISKNINAK